MTHQDLAMNYLSCFCAGDIDGLRPLLADSLRFSGPFHSFHSASAYLDGLRADPPQKCRYKVISVTENENSVAVFYEYYKPERTMLIAQLFGINERRIEDILLVFDAGTVG